MAYENLPYPLKHPDDDPQWGEFHKHRFQANPHDWRKYISEEVQAMWDTFTTEQKAALIRQADEVPDNEVWD